MATFAAVYSSKTAWQLQLDVSESSPQPANNRSYVSWALHIYRGNGDTPWNNDGSGYSVSAPGGVSGTFGGFRFGGSGSGTDYSGTPVGGRVLIASGGGWVGHNPDGSGSVTVSASHASGTTLGTANIGSSGFPLTKLTSLPGTPTSVAGVRNSDSQVTVSWAQSSPSNGQPTTNTVRRMINGGAWANAANISPASSVALTAAANQKIIYGVVASNSAGSSAYSASSIPIYTTPAAPSSVSAAKSGSDIIVSWANNVAFSEYETVVWHGVVSDGTTTWDGSALTTVGTGGTSYTHEDPDNSQVHAYRVQAKNLDTGALTSAFVQSNSVQLLASPNAPTFGTVPRDADKAADLVVGWEHNPVDTTGQTAYEFGYSTDGGSTWESTGKVTSGTSSYTISASTYAGNETVTVRVRTWGSATSGGPDDTGVSPWSTTETVTFKTLPVASITSPADSSTATRARLTVVLGFTQAESASFVRATIGLYRGGELLEEVVSTTLGGTRLVTKVRDDATYTVKATVLDSNGLNSSQVSSTFSVAYTLPVMAGVTVVYLEDSAIAQLDLAIPSPGTGEAAAVTVTIMRTIDGKTETVVEEYPTTAELTILDMTPTIHGTNEYTVTTFSADGATADTAATSTTTEGQWAFLSSGEGFDTIVNFIGNLRFASTPARSNALVATAGRTRPIALFGESGTLEISGSAVLVPDKGSTWREVENLILTAGRVCYRDPSGRRMFGTLTGALDFPNSLSTGFTYAISEAS
ncbi:hypothetical protein [Cryobacterium sp. Y62]|uniref:hypothetical protein n=1 Tax=Cryobacterium sp. Y62 TaxID=2048284 RepID=UPI0011B0A6EF|nr:hypothetical protein [Cryobacterium sp. Y62]